MPGWEADLLLDEEPPEPMVAPDVGAAPVRQSAFSRLPDELLNL